MDDVTWGALAFILTVLGGGYTYWAFRNRGVAAGTRGAALTLLPAAAWLTDTLKMLTEVVDAVAGWATHFAFSPTSWAGIILAGLSAMLFGVSGYVGRRGARPVDAADPSAPKATATPKNRSGELGRSKGRAAPAIDDDLSEIEAILKNRGIS